MTETAGHLFLTGEMGIGKSTLLKKLMARTEGPVGGFFTVKSEQVFPGRSSLHLLSLKEPLIPSASNFLAFCGERKEETAKRFNRLGHAALTAVKNPGLLVMDELGPHESEALLFWEAVFHALDGPVPVLGVLQKAASPFLEKVRSHPRVKVVEVTRENRDKMMDFLQDHEKVLMKSGSL